MTTHPLLTVAVPTYRRADLLERCLESLLPQDPTILDEVELVVSDNSPESDVEQLVERFSATWDGELRYQRNPAGTGAVRNFNHCVERARGRYTLILHDDDYLLPGALDAMVRTLQTADPDRDSVLLFGVRVEDLSGRLRRRQEFSRDLFLPPDAAFRRLLGNSSFVRVPGLVVDTEAYRAVGGFRVEAHTTCDFDMAVRLFGRHGVRCVSTTTAVYTVHAGGVTTTVFNPRTVELNQQIFAVATSMGVLSADEVRRRQRDWFHQFILAGTWRALRAGDRMAARQVYDLFALPGIRALGVSPRWLPVRCAFFTVAGGSRARPQAGSADDATQTTRVGHGDAADETAGPKAPDW